MVFFLRSAGDWKITYRRVARFNGASRPLSQAFLAQDRPSVTPSKSAPPRETAAGFSFCGLNQAQQQLRPASQAQQQLRAASQAPQQLRSATLQQAQRAAARVASGKPGNRKTGVDLTTGLDRKSRADLTLAAGLSPVMRQNACLKRAINSS